MSKLEFFIICESVSIDQRSNRLSIFNVIENINAPQFPANVPLILCVLSLRKEKDDEGMDYQLLLKIHSSANDEPFEFRMNFIMERERHRLLINLDQMVVKSAGELIFEVYINENLLDTRTLNVLLAPNNPK